MARIRAHPVGYPIKPPVETIEVKDAAITNAKVASGIVEGKISWDTVTGHKHDGTLARQTAHADLAGIGTDDHHAKLHVSDHASGGADPLTDAIIDGIVGFDLGAHAARHRDGGADPIDLAAPIWKFREKMEFTNVTSVDSSVFTAHDLWRLLGVIRMHETGQFLYLMLNKSTAYYYDTQYLTAGTATSRSEYSGFVVGQSGFYAHEVIVNCIINSGGVGFPIIVGVSGGVQNRWGAVQGCWRNAGAIVTQFSFTSISPLTGKVLIFSLDFADF